VATSLFFSEGPDSQPFVDSETADYSAQLKHDFEEPFILAVQESVVADESVVAANADGVNEHSIYNECENAYWTTNVNFFSDLHINIPCI
jgi:hypothetical protein